MSNDIYKQFLDELPIGYACQKLVFDSQGLARDIEYTQVNQMFEHFMGRQRFAIMGRSVLDLPFLIEKEQSQGLSFYEEIVVSGKPKENEAYSKSLDKWFKVITYSAENHRFISLFLDISDEMKTIAEHKEIILTLNDITFEMDEGFLFQNVIVADDDKLFMPRKDIIGKSVRELFSPDLAELFVSVCEKAKYSGCKEAVTYKSPVPGDERWFKAETHYAEIWKKKRFIVRIHDITATKKLEDQLASLKEDYETVFQGTQDNLFLVKVGDKGEFRFSRNNKAHEESTGITTENIRGKTPQELVGEDLGNVIAANYQCCVDKQAPLSYEETMELPTGKRTWATTLTPVYKQGRISSIVGSSQDISERKAMEEALFLEKEWLKTTLESIGDGVISIDNQGNVLFMNRIAEQLTGWSKAVALGKPLEDVFRLIADDAEAPYGNPAQEVLRTGKPMALSYPLRLIASSGVERYIEESAAPIQDREGKINGAVIVFKDVTEKREKQIKIEYLSYHDLLTGLYNRRYLEDAMRRLDVPRNLPLTLMILDINGLKLTNDAFGHETGDCLIETVAETIKKACREDDIVARIGGDEFAIILPRTGHESAVVVKKRILEAVSQTKLESVCVSVAIGYGVKTNPAQDFLKIQKEADRLMYKDKLTYGKTMRSRTIETVLRNINHKYDQEQIHTEMVSGYCAAIAQAMGLSDKEIIEAKTAGSLHDIGKILVPPEILNKSGRLSEHEFALIKRHPETGYQILKNVDEYIALAETVLLHHERMDGTGYPQGLSGEKIPLLARIVAVADAYEAMIAIRPYQKSKSKQEAIAELKKCSGTQFDEKVAKVFVEKVLGEPWTQVMP